ncbi:SDR family oxidoreductase [Anabaena cylindrica FACHB-243]|uniref:NADP oxidoreductase coenzyme F420-dependent n=1 Tax=Anabaena cylindrica (strain ATCC 27899 / PCC 7122) TaxID=272123 RepID=K9ZGU6_ANACC|nr:MULTISPECIES: SDR family oxidoreductase [Anabaena]AFZ58458.1 NADP oxidoreductase coenzyme F420-dependent [Anabaena cylindrica PCC 7122]MBD2417319.1 SDR family oxidoreductase [Anabaena cylindrica FACHB-243]MBY5282427.1 SDR family oxidoreductase [Anabaena sp. CCAP 1446/1C]MBY5308774.1 SDR family oxidoreductase [Anabaena sp. CCAP 1446/1C]MCM2410118.1 SDR family oxidoreductase [Anabaena sp. CCAP 1446/1C]
MSQLENKVALILGGAGNVGEGIVRAFLKAGAIVVVPSRKVEKLEELRTYLGELAQGDRFIPIVGEIGQIDSAESIRDQLLKQFGRLDAVVASLGGWWFGNRPLTEVLIAEWQQYLDSNLTSHFIAARTFLPILQERKGASYTLIGGAAAEVPIPNVSPVSISAAGQLMLAQVLMQENKGSSIRINEVIVHSWVATRSSEERSQPTWITADDIGEFTAWLASDAASMVNSSLLRLYEKPVT